MFTCRVGSVLVGRLARVAVAEAIHGQDSEGVVNMRGQAQLGRGGSTGNLCQVGPNPWLVEQILILDQELWRNFKKGENFTNHIQNFIEYWIQNIEALEYFLTLCGAVVLVSRDPCEPYAPLCLVSHLQVSWWVRSLCQRDNKSKNKKKNTCNCNLIK